MKHWKPLATAIGTAIALILVILFWLGPERIWETLVNANPYYLGLALGIQILDVLVLTTRWHIFLRNVGDIDFKTTLALTVCGTAVSNITPSGRVGGEPLKAYLLKKRYGIRYGASFATIILERIVDMLAFLIISFVAIFYGIVYFKLPGHVIFLLVIAFLFSLSILLGLWYVTLKKRLRSEGISDWLEKHEWISKKIPVLNYYKEKLTDSLLNYYSHVAKIASNTDALMYGFLVSIVYWFLEISRAYVIFLALGINAPFPVIALAYVFSAIIGSLPFGVGGVGLTEGTMILIYSTSAINSVVASLATLIDRLISYWLMIFVGLPVAGYLGIEAREESKNGGLHDSTG